GLGLKKAEGALVAEPQPDSPAAKAGIKAGDVITAVNGKPVEGPRELARMIGAMSPDTEVKLSIVRDGSEQTVAVRLDKMPAQTEARADVGGDREGGTDLGRLGLRLAPASRVA